MNKFFLGKRVTGPRTLDIRDVKGKLSCTMTEEWIGRKDWSFGCGEKRKYTLTKILGTSVTDRQDLESTISSSLNLSGISELKSEIKAKLGREVRIDETTQEEETFEFESPKCGRVDYTLYQLRRGFEFVYQDKRTWILRLFNDRSFSKKN